MLIGTFQGATVLAAEVPAGVLADTMGRRLALVVAHVVSGIGMAMAGVVTTFPLLVVANCLWGLGWAFASGADVSWLTDELRDDRDDHAGVDRVLAAQGRWDLLGNPVGIAGFGVLAWVTSLATAMVCAGVAFVAIGLLVVARWPETRQPTSVDGALSPFRDVLRRGFGIVRVDRVVLAVVVATLLLNGSSEVYGRLYERRLVMLGMPVHPDPIVWFTVLRLATVALGVVSLRFIELRITAPDVARRAYVVSCLVAAVGLVLFAYAPDLRTAVVAALLVAMLEPITRVTATIRVNRRTTSNVRATVHSALSWSENLGEVIFGLTLAVVAALASSTAALIGSAVLLVCAGAAGSVRDHGPSTRVDAG